MPKAENIEGEQRYGLMEQERSISGQKRICFCYGQLIGKLERCLPWIIIISYPLVYIIGFYSGFNSNCICNGSV